MYLMDYDGDGLLDLVYPDLIRNQLILVRNPGQAYWSKIVSTKDKYAMASKDRLQKEVNTVVDKWHTYSMIDSGYSLQIRDFVFVNIDTEDKLSIVVLGQDSIRKNGTFNRYRLVLSIPKAQAGYKRAKQAIDETPSTDLQTEHKCRIEIRDIGKSDKAGTYATGYLQRHLSDTLCV